MKKILLSLATVAVLFTSCDSDDTTTEPILQPATGEITGEITANTSLPYGNYTLKGIVKVASGVTLTIAEGSTITADKTNGEDALVILKGGKINLVGTADKPIVFTEKSKISGSWGGIIMYGDAPIVNSASAPAPQTATSEDGLNLSYGGANTAHDGGKLVFVRVEYAGMVIQTNNKEHNGFSFYSVGTGTTLQNLVSYKGNDDGFEFYGGTVSATNLISYGNSDDAFDWQDGWRGQNNMNWFAYQTGVANYGMEIEAKGVNNAFWPVVKNITLKRAAGTTTEAQGEIQLDAFQFKKEGNGDFSNIVIDGYKNQTSPSAFNGGAIQILDLATYNNQVLTGKIKLLNVKATNTDNQFLSGASSFTTTAASFGTNFTTSSTSNGATLATGAWATVDGVNLLSNL